MIAILLQLIDRFALAYMLALNSFHGLLLLLSMPELWSHWHLAEDDHLMLVLGTEALPPVSVLVPVHNEEATIVERVMSCLTLQYPRHEVVVVNDGSIDETLARLVQAYDLYEVPPAFVRAMSAEPIRAYYRSRRHSTLLVIDKSHSGRPDALNAAIDAARFPYVLPVDVGTYLEADALLRLARPIALGNPVAAVFGARRVANACVIARGRVTEARVDKRILPAVQLVERLRVSLFGRLGWNRLGGTLTDGDGIGLFKRGHLVAIHGYRSGTASEDTDLIARLQRYVREQRSPDVITLTPDPVAWTEVPRSLGSVGRQVERRHRAMLEIVRAHRDLFFNLRFGRIGLIAYPFAIFGEALAPAIELLGYLGVGVAFAFGAVDLNFAWLFLSAVVSYGILLSTWAILLEQVSVHRYARPVDVLRLLLAGVIEGLGYRQLSLFFRLRATWHVLLEDRRRGAAKPERLPSDRAAADDARKAA
ncbi:MAG TPA: glycosyltransferase [Gemmatimonadaceae bacterium]|nr:glycosyltransferase [Gemmatimonadaceae bacterium]